MCPECRHIPDRKHIRNLCQDTSHIAKIPAGGLYRDIMSRPAVWLYEGRNNGWWYYDNELQDILEETWREDETFIDWLICGQKVHIDLFNMQQTNLQNNAVRAIMRLTHKEIAASDSLLIKGVAGMMPK